MICGVSNVRREGYECIYCPSLITASILLTHGLLFQYLTFSLLNVQVSMMSSTPANSVHLYSMSPCRATCMGHGSQSLIPLCAHYLVHMAR